jgi:hypothetical protein
MIRFVSYLLKVGGSLRVVRLPDKINIHMHLFPNFCFQLGNCPLYVPNITSQADKIMFLINNNKCYKLEEIIA